MAKLLKHYRKQWNRWYAENKFLFWLGVAVWFFLIIMTGKRSISYFLVSDLEPNYSVFYMRGLLVWTLAAFFIPLAVKISNRFSLDRPPHAKHFAIHIVAGVVFLLILATFFTFLWRLRMNPEEISQGFLTALRSNLVWLSLLAPAAYWMIVGGQYFNKYYTRYKERQRKSLVLRSELKKMQHQVLQMQMHPHFLFNALNTVSSFIEHEPDEAEIMLKEIQAFLRISVEDHDQAEVTLDEELGLVDTYLSIEQKRFSDRLRVEKHIEQQARKVLVPRLLLQPLVENAIRHGISAKRASGLLTLKAEVKGELLQINIADDGKGIDQSKLQRNSGLGLKNTIQRLQMLYNTSYTFEIEPSEPSGTQITIKIPVRQNQ